MIRDEFLKKEKKNTRILLNEYMDRLSMIKNETLKIFQLTCFEMIFVVAFNNIKELDVFSFYKIYFLLKFCGPDFFNGKAFLDFSKMLENTLNTQKSVSV